MNSGFSRFVPGSVVVVGALASMGGAGCSKTSEAATQPAAARTAITGESVSKDNYTVQIRQAGPCKKGDTCTLEVSLETRGDYHINDKYPYKFKTQDPPADGVKYPKPVVGRDDGTFEEKKAVLKVPFSADAAGDAKVGGTLSLSVCSAANCLMDKQALDTTAKVE